MTCLLFLFFLQCQYTVEEDSEGDNDSEEFYYGGQASVNKVFRVLNKERYINTLL